MPRIHGFNSFSRRHDEIALSVLLVASSALAESDFVKPLKEAATREEFVKHFGQRIGFGEVEKWEFHHLRAQAHGLWILPVFGTRCLLRARLLLRRTQTELVTLR
jgi:hypothetical protein